MQNRYNWAIEEIYASVVEWEKDYKRVESEIDFSEFKGRLNEKKEFLACMKKEERLGRILEKLSVYAMMKHDENTRDSEGDRLYSKVTSLGAKFGAQTSFIVTELTSLDQSVLNSYICDKELSDYDYSLKCILKGKEHVLSEKEEELLALSYESFSSFRDIFTKIDNADLDFGYVRQGLKKIPLSHGTYSVCLQSKDRSLRKKAFKKYYKGYISLINTISSIYYGNVKKNALLAKVKKYNGVLDMALSGEDVDQVVYKKLIESVNGALPLLHKYVCAKKKNLGLNEMHMYDMYVPTVKSADIKLEYEKAYDLVIEGLSVLGSEYVDLLKKARENRWLDVYEKQGKRSGAYSVAVYDTHPYVLLNYQQTTHDVFTIAHEMGHSIHSYYSNKNQPYAKADYKIFVAEVASTVNEVLLIKYLIKKESNKKVKKYLLSYLLEMIRTTLFRQTQFAEFEEFTHKQVENGEPLTKESMCDEYMRLNKKYYGKAVVSDEEIKYEWARIPHFYRAFYVYKYATGIISAMAIVKRITEQGESAIKDYFRFLSSGSSDGPVELLKIAGVDLTSDKPYELAFSEFEETLNEYINL